LGARITIEEFGEDSRIQTTATTKLFSSEILLLTALQGLFNTTQMACLAGHQELMPVILATQEAELRRITGRGQPQENSSQDPISKTPSQKRAGGVNQVVEGLPTRCEALSSNLRATKKRRGLSTIKDAKLVYSYYSK
jgi:hypothetical protein